MASQGLEVELKLALEAQNLPDAFVSRLGPPQRILTQRNHYYQSPQAPGMTIRLRVEITRCSAEQQPRSGWILTVKGKSTTKDGGLFVRPEAEATLEVPDGFTAPGELAVALLVSHDLTRHFGPEFRYLGCLENIRRLFHHDGFSLELDQTWYPHLQAPEWELEVETDRFDEVGPAMTKLLSELGVKFQPQSQGKFSRFLQGCRCSS